MLKDPQCDVYDVWGWSARVGSQSGVSARAGHGRTARSLAAHPQGPLESAGASFVRATMLGLVGRGLTTFCSCGYTTRSGTGQARARVAYCPGGSCTP